MCDVYDLETGNCERIWVPWRLKNLTLKSVTTSTNGVLVNSSPGSVPTSGSVTLFMILNFLSFFLYIMPYALADILGMLRCRASKYVNR